MPIDREIVPNKYFVILLYYLTPDDGGIREFVLSTSPTIAGKIISPEDEYQRGLN